MYWSLSTERKNADILDKAWQRSIVHATLQSLMGDAVVAAQCSRPSGPGSSPGGVKCCVFGQVPLSPRSSINGYRRQNAGGWVAILLVASCYRNQDKLRQLWATRLVKTLPTYTTKLALLFGVLTPSCYIWWWVLSSYWLYLLVKQSCYSISSQIILCTSVLSHLIYMKILDG